MRRGDLYAVNFEPSVSGEPARTRPAVILTNNLANESLPHLVVAPITSNVSREYPFDVMLPAGSCGLPESSRVQLNYIRGLNRTRIGAYLGSLTPTQLADLDRRLKVHLGLS
ncbi:type II toxin-antitoxin system PemK/MazF family toxin [Deinococcus koreensis]|uniref:type II toxin-antitoxin system PemK/MazF family toxin n=1 Tax=Deinococcus koreensis TaxID=2054903 RepID=UPI0013FDDACB|nr:type II toxin-antitoxin system PemK/MazF family toxin [Deinococcus koreensis]